MEEVKRIHWGGGEAPAGSISHTELVKWQVAQVYRMEAELGVAHDQAELYILENTEEMCTKINQKGRYVPIVQVK